MEQRFALKLPNTCLVNIVPVLQPNFLVLNLVCTHTRTCVPVHCVYTTICTVCVYTHARHDAVCRVDGKNGVKFSTAVLNHCVHKRKVFFSGSCLTLVLTTVLGRPRPTDAKNSVKNYQGHANCFPRKCDPKIPKLFQYILLNFTVIMI